MKQLIYFALLASLALMQVSVRAQEGGGLLESLELGAVSALDGRAVIKTPHKKMHILELGTVIPGTRATVTQILPDKLVVEDTADGTPQTVWISKSGTYGSVTVQRIENQAPPGESLPLYALYTSCGWCEASP